MKINVTKVNLTGGTQSRVGINDSTAEEYADLMIDGVEFPPITVFFDGSEYWLADGWHRLTAAILATKDTIEAEVINGTRRDAVLYAVGANAGHGLRRTNADKRKAVMMLLEDAEWVLWSDREIARQCHVSHPHVASIRETYLEKLPDSKDTSQERKVERNGTTYVQNTANIGKSQKPIEIPQESTATIEPMESIEPQYHPLDDYSNYEPHIDDIVLSNEYFACDVIPKKMMEACDSLNGMCDERIVNSWTPMERTAVRSKLTLLKSRIDYVLMNI